MRPYNGPFLAALAAPPTRTLVCASLPWWLSWWLWRAQTGLEAASWWLQAVVMMAARAPLQLGGVGGALTGAEEAGRVATRAEQTGGATARATQANDAPG